MIDVARDTLKEIPMADILRERLSLALDQSAALEREKAELQAKCAKLEAQLDIVTLDRNETRKELQRLKDESCEEIVIHEMVEFRRGKRTGGKWMAFCPKCRMPAADDQMPGGRRIAYCTAQCGWRVEIMCPVKQLAQGLNR